MSRIETIGNATLIEWLCERRDNAASIARTKAGEDRAGWLEDASFFDAAVHAVRGYERLRTFSEAKDAKA